MPKTLRHARLILRVVLLIGDIQVCIMLYVLQRSIIIVYNTSKYYDKLEVNEIISHNKNLILRTHLHNGTATGPYFLDTDPWKHSLL